MFIKHTRRGKNQTEEREQQKKKISQFPYGWPWRYGLEQAQNREWEGSSICLLDMK